MRRVTLYLHVAWLQLEALALALFLCALPLVVLAAWAWLVWQIEGERVRSWWRGYVSRWFNTEP